MAMRLWDYFDVSQLPQDEEEGLFTITTNMPIPVLV